uniref:ORF2 n=1 Tax=Bougainvillea chlorotic vein banding virus TaxID=263892 RepID=A0A4P9D4D4_9VIRU|nr:ORF2 [Bougainvillea chlorotic vein banding virus]
MSSSTTWLTIKNSDEFRESREGLVDIYTNDRAKTLPFLIDWPKAGELTPGDVSAIHQNNLILFQLFKITERLEKLSDKVQLLEDHLRGPADLGSLEAKFAQLGKQIDTIKATSSGGKFIKAPPPGRIRVSKDPRVAIAEVQKQPHQP